MTPRLLAVAALAVVAAACDRSGAPIVDASWQAGGGYRWRALAVPSRGKPGFRRLSSSSTGVTHRNDVADSTAIYNRNLLIGAGVAAGDIDRDGLPDLFLASVERPAALYRNAGGMRFVDITDSAGIDTRALATTGAAFADVNGDGNQDLVVATLGGPLKLWLGDGRARFVDATDSSGLTSGLAGTTMTLADVEGDGDLDLYVATYKKRNALDVYTPQQRAFDQVVKKVGSEYRVVDEWRAEFRIEDHPELGGIVRSQRAEPDLFFLNDGKGKFTRVPQLGARFLDENGRPLAQELDFFTLAARFFDVNGDAAPDLYVCNDFEDPDQFWINDGRGNFRLAPALSLRATSNTCMSVDFADIDNDGAVDFFTADMMSPTLAQRQRQLPTHTPAPKRPGLALDRQQWMRNALQLGRGDGTWAEIAEFAGVAATDWTWGSAFLDVDLDGREDLIAVNGHRWDVRDADTFERIRNAFPRVPWNREQGEFPASATRSFVFRNNGDLTFRDMSREWGIGDDAAVTHGLALADLDGDGDLDVVTSRLNGEPAMYENTGVAPRVAVRLAGSGANRAGIGARVTVRATGLPPQTKEVTAGGYYLSGSDSQLTFAAADSGTTIEVRWRDGRVTRIEQVRPNRLYEIDAAEARPPAAQPAPPAPYFENATRLLAGHTHADSTFDDYRRQSLLPNRFSQLGPGVAWADVDNDGRADLAVGSGRGGRVTILRNTAATFAPRSVGSVAGDVTTILPVPDGRGGLALVAGQSNYETSSPAEALALPALIALTPGVGVPELRDTASVGPMALGDVNGDGRLDLFVGARVVPGAWPLPGRSRLFLRNADGGWALDGANAATLGRIGLVSAALFTDLDGDGRSELVTTAEWGPIRVFKSDGGVLRDATSAWGLSGTTSRWNGLSAGDFDGDGRMDLVATSWGRNVTWKATPERPHTLIAGNFGQEGIALLFARKDSATGQEVPLETFPRVGIAVPDVRRRIATFADYSRATTAQLLGDAARGAVRVGATTYDHLVLLNRGGRFEARPLPPHAQLAPAFAPVVADFDGDGREDLYLAQNFSATNIETPRFNAGAGLMLLGDGSGEFRALGVRESGISVLGDQRGAAASDYDRDGRVDLAVSQNAAETTLWHNRGARPGIRVRLDGGPDNPYGVGAQLRLISTQTQGPTREIRVGSGYWSVDDPVAVLGGTGDSVWVRWPGGKEQRLAIAGQRELRIAAPR